MEQKRAKKESKTQNRINQLGEVHGIIDFVSFWAIFLTIGINYFMVKFREARSEGNIPVSLSQNQAHESLKSASNRALS